MSNLFLRLNNSSNPSSHPKIRRPSRQVRSAKGGLSRLLGTQQPRKPLRTRVPIHHSPFFRIVWLTGHAVFMLMAVMGTLFTLSCIMVGIDKLSIFKIADEACRSGSRIYLVLVLTSQSATSWEGTNRKGRRRPHNLSSKNMTIRSSSDCQSAVVYLYPLQPPVWSYCHSGDVHLQLDE